MLRFMPKELKTDEMKIYEVYEVFITMAASNIISLYTFFFFFLIYTIGNYYLQIIPLV